MYFPNNYVFYSFLARTTTSVARRRLLQTVGIEPIICPSDFDESQIQLNEPAELVQTLAQYMKLVSENNA